MPTREDDKGRNKWDKYGDDFKVGLFVCLFVCLLTLKEYQ